VLINMKEHLVARLEPGGYLVLSGILIDKAAEVKCAFAGDVHFFKELHEEQWACLVFQKG